MLQWMKHSLIGNTPEHDVVQQCDLFGQLHGRQSLKTLGLRTLRLEIHEQRSVERRCGAAVPNSSSATQTLNQLHILGIHLVDDWVVTEFTTAGISNNNVILTTMK